MTELPYCFTLMGSFDYFTPIYNYYVSTKTNVYKISLSDILWWMGVIQALWKLIQEDYTFEACVCFTVGSYLKIK